MKIWVRIISIILWVAIISMEVLYLVSTRFKEQMWGIAVIILIVASILLGKEIIEWVRE